MAHFQTVIETYSLWSKVVAPFQTFGGLLIRLSEANVRVRELERLSKLSDAELSEIGVARNDIVRHVFSGSL